MTALRTAAKSVFAMADRFLPSPRGPRILIYHQVGAGLGRQMEVTVNDFELQLDWLIETHTVVDLESAIQRWSEPDSDRLVVLTFDDGYRDTFTKAFPLLSDRCLPFVLYLTSNPIESGSSLGPAEGAEPLSWDMVEAMVDSDLVTIGAHTHTHPDLRDAPLDQVVEELAASDKLIESRTGVRPRHFAYPWGYWSEVAAPFVRERYASAVLGGLSKPPSDPDVYSLHRYPVQLSDRLRFFRARVSGGLLFEEKTRRLLRGYSGP